MRTRVQAVAVVLATVALMAASPTSGLAQSRMSTRVDTTLVTVGDHITMTVTVDHPAGARVAWPDSVDLAPFEVVEARVLPTEAMADGARSSALITVTAFELGELELPALEIEVVGADGASEMLRTDRFGIEVQSVGIDEGGDIREIRGPLSIPIGVVRLAGWALILLLLVALILVLRRFFKRADPAGVAPAPRAPPVDPWVTALAALDRLEASPILERGQVKEYHIEVSEIVRRYVEGRFDVDALEMTTAEVVVGLERAQVDPTFRQDLRRFLDQCDMVKFAKVRPTAEASRAVLALGRDLVEGSIPTPTAATPAGAPAEAQP